MRLKPTKSSRKSKAFTLVEVTISLAIISVIVMAVNNVIANQYSGLDKTFRRIFGETAEGVVKVRKAFNGTCRKASLRNITIEDDGETLTLYYYSDHTDPPYWPDKYAKYYLNSNDEFCVEHGDVVFGTLQQLSSDYTEILCGDVSYLSFSAQGLSVELCMTIDEGSDDFTFTWTAVRHN
ncbi:prepilin-type N-terminal cleavage/methylation domain-containing protein [Sedimentisphaera salicampi]|uniref:prepilin-type N-terminal cleavage/methylation domain-containing protein n=1 Tax=Sedimentisphaera salicampi TaxID=1941349 RepID=UPI000B9C50B8|nr:prepilin-type N-terminal cleavage/methylation domain-containing protein [Sedimentisphaera salicampi]OXU16143.1 hypothetical protein SMSP1_00083 [Sedimentisphaera salicampi]